MVAAQTLNDESLCLRHNADTVRKNADDYDKQNNSRNKLHGFLLFLATILQLFSFQYSILRKVWLAKALFSCYPKSRVNC